MSTRLKTLIDNLDDLPESIDPRDLYEPGQGSYEGKYVLAPEAVGSLRIADVKNLESAKAHEKRAAQEAKAALKEAQAEIERLQKAAADMEATIEEGGADTKKLRETIAKQLQDDFDRKAKSIAQEYESKVRELEQSRSTLDAQLDEELVTNRIRDRLTNGPIKGPAGPMVPFLKQFVKAQVGEDGRKRTVVIDPETGAPKTRYVGGEEKAYEIDDLLGELARNPEYREFLRAEAPRASGAPQGTQQADRSRSGVIRLSADEARDPDRYRRARAEAEKNNLRFEIDQPGA